MAALTATEILDLFPFHYGIYVRMDEAAAKRACQCGWMRVKLGETRMVWLCQCPLKVF